MYISLYFYISATSSSIAYIYLQLQYFIVEIIMKSFLIINNTWIKNFLVEPNAYFQMVFSVVLCIGNKDQFMNESC